MNEDEFVSKASPAEMMTDEQRQRASFSDEILNDHLFTSGTGNDEIGLQRMDGIFTTFIELHKDKPITIEDFNSIVTNHVNFLIYLQPDDWGGVSLLNDRGSGDSVYVSDNFSKLYCFFKLQKSGQSFDQEVQSSLNELLDMFADYKKFKEQVWSRQEQSQREITQGNREFEEKYGNISPAIKLLYPILNEIKNHPETPLEQIKNKIDQDANQPADSIHYIGGFTGSQTSFSMGYEAFTSAELIELLDDNSLSRLSEIRTVEDAVKFIESMPLSGKKIAEIGGTQSSILQVLGAEVDNASIGESAQKGLGGDSLTGKSPVIVNLSNWKDYFKEGYYNLTCSHMVLDKGSGIENMHPDQYAAGHVDSQLLAAEFYSIMSQMTKVEGASIHVGAHLILKGGLTSAEQQKQQKRFTTIFKDGMKHPVRKDATGSTIHYRKTIGDRTQFLWDDENSRFKHTHGFEIKNEHTSQESSGLGFAGTLVQFEKVSEPNLKDLADIKTLID